LKAQPETIKGSRGGGGTEMEREGRDRRYDWGERKKPEHRIILNLLFNYCI